MIIPNGFSLGIPAAALAPLYSVDPGAALSSVSSSS